MTILLRKTLASFLTVLLFCMTSCTSSVKMSASDLQGGHHDGSTLYRAMTTDGMRYDFKQYTASEDTLMLHDPTALDVHDEKQTPKEVTLLFSDIATIERIDRDAKKSLISVAALGAAVTGGIFLMLFIAYR